MPRSEPQYGPVESEVRRDLEQAKAVGPVDRSLVALAYRLAGQVDQCVGEDVRLLPSLSRELRAVLAQLGAGQPSGGEDDDLDDLAAPA